MENKVTVTFTTNEAQILLQLIDLAVKSQGLRAAEASYLLAKKIEDELMKVNQSATQGKFQPPQAFSPTT